MLRVGHQQPATTTLSHQPQRGSAAPYHGRLGATTRWGDNVRVEGHANGMLLDRVQLVRPAPPSHHCDAQGAQGVKGLCPELAWPPQVRSYLTVRTCGREPSWESRYVQQGRRWRQPPTITFLKRQRGEEGDGLYEKARALEAVKYRRERVAVQGEDGGERRSPRLLEAPAGGAGGGMC